MAPKRLGEILVEVGLLTADQLNQALTIQQASRERLGDVLINKGYITQSQLIEVLEFQLGIPHVQLSRYRIDPSILKLVPERLAKAYQAIPFRKEGTRLYVAMVDPLDFYAIDDLRMSTGFSIEPAIASREDIQTAIRRYYELQESVDAAVQSVPEVVIEEDVNREDAPVVRLLNQILMAAVSARASDIHLDPQSDGLRIRYRVDGFLRTERVLPRHMQNVINARVKVLANLNIAEQRLPQDGRFQYREGLHAIDVRVSTMPTAHGEKVVMRILDLNAAVLHFDQLGFSPENLAKFKEMLSRPYGEILITGPTGSGKTSTLYAALRTKATEEVNVVTIEDPIEYQMEGVNQIQVHPAMGLTFARGLRAILRQDPDILMIGEIRDEETAEIASRAAVTGHLVFSTLHTNDAPSAIGRLIDMGIEPYMVASALTGVIGQRLVRRVCPNCAASYTPTALETHWLTSRGFPTDSLVVGKGCSICNHTGYLGRLAIHEVFVMDDEIARLVLAKESNRTFREYAMDHGMVTMLDDGLQKAIRQETTIQEVMRVTAHDVSE
ncbi:GspE/PulE family protein [Alicyclobacillus acidiphilus]|uniref:GspE/PulE family protein n=1 Tax=Alicyclobacillus acidiphilus TaxID=182455 RepID=UPI000829AAC2|nr:GspE/PulE family protein [Alicyclobacillus acidiphilus]